MAQLVFLIVVLSASGIRGSNALFTHFVQDAVQYFGSIHPAFVLPELDCDTQRWKSDLSMSFICDSGSTLLNTISNVSNQHDLDMIIYPYGNLSTLITDELWNNLLGTTIITIIPMDAAVNDTKLRLDSNLYLFESPTPKLINLWERYSNWGRRQ